MGCVCSKLDKPKKHDPSQAKIIDDTGYLENVDKKEVIDQEKIEIRLQEKESITKASVVINEVPPHPPKTKKQDIIPDPAVFKHIDEHALKVQSFFRRSVSELAIDLVKPAENNLERVRAFYRWITENISYDTESYFSDVTSSCDANDVIQTGKSVCEGYAELFSAFCREVNIPVKTIIGHAKGYNYDPEIDITPSTKTNHAWNVVLLDGDWRFMECTWGAGYLQEQKFHKQFTEFYFLTDPGDFINRHYPCTNKGNVQDSKWQLLDEPVSMKEFCRSVKYSHTALECGIIPISHKSGVIELTSDDTITIKDGQRSIESWIIKFSLSDGTDMSKYVMSYIQDQTTLKINVRPPTAAKYILKVFAKPVGKNTDVHNSILEYIIKCSNPAKSVKPYPSRKSPWAFCPEYKQYGFAEGSIATPMFTAVNGKLCINIPTTKQIDAIAKIRHAESRDISLDNCTLVESSANKMVLRARFPIEGFYELDIMAKRPWEENGKYWPSISYLIDCRKPMIPCYPFPEYYNSAIIKYNCRLIEPLKGHLPAKSSIKFRLESNILQRIRILEHNLRKTGAVTFEGTVDIPETGKITVFGSENESGGSLSGLYRFTVEK
ncbi:hypothetical protein ACJMK2_026722 [Sinanodonta woodiana]|uniref:Transglutaminase-like domain-containing protein n=1 Tax=Sinanodonta woodiana TaxID=1069815 RepID=A0ABD3XKT2_SINWO